MRYKIRKRIFWIFVSLILGRITLETNPENFKSIANPNLEKYLSRGSKTPGFAFPRNWQKRKNYKLLNEKYIKNHSFFTLFTKLTPQMRCQAKIFHENVICTKNFSNYAPSVWCENRQRHIGCLQVCVNGRFYRF